MQIAEPDDRWEASLSIDGLPVELRKAYTALRAEKSTFVGFYADLSHLSPARPHRIELDLPVLKPGQFGGVFRLERFKQEGVKRNGSKKVIAERPLSAAAVLLPPLSAF